MDERSLYRRAARDFRRAESGSKDWRTKALACQKFFAGDQWSPEDKDFLSKQKRPTTTFNLIAPNIKAVVGMELGNRQEIRYNAREKAPEDQIAADIYNQGAKWIFDLAEAEFEVSMAFKDLLVTGIGCTQVKVDYDDDPDGQVQIIALDPRRKWWDPAAKRPGLVDRRYDFTIVDMDKAEFKHTFRDFKGEPKSHVFSHGPDKDIMPEPELEERDDPYRDSSDSNMGDTLYAGRVRVAEYNYFDWEPCWKVYAPDGSAQHLWEDEWKALRAKLAGAQFVEGKPQETFADIPIVWFEKMDRRRFRRAWFTGDELIETTENADPSGFTDHFLTGELDAAKGGFIGLVEPMMDPQSWANKMFNQILHTVNVNAKGGIYAFDDSFVNPKKAERDFAKPDAILFVNQKYASIDAAIKERMPSPYPAAMGQILEFTIGILPKVTGINYELLGLSGKDQPGILESMRKQAGMAILAGFFDALRLHRKLLGRTLIHFMRTYVGPERLAKIVQQEDREGIQIAMLPDAAKFDVVVDESPQSPNQKLLNFKLLTDYLQIDPAVGPLLNDLILENAPLPSALQGAIKQRLEESRKPDPVAQGLQRAELDLLLSEVKKNLAQAELSMAKADSEGEKIDVATLRESVQLARAKIDMMTKIATKHDSTKEKV